jgi:hypothetical protein
MAILNNNLNDNNASIRGGEFIKTQNEAQKNGRYSNQQSPIKSSIGGEIPASIYHCTIKQKRSQVHPWCL